MPTGPEAASQVVYGRSWYPIASTRRRRVPRWQRQNSSAIRSPSLWYNRTLANGPGAQLRPRPAAAPRHVGCPHGITPRLARASGPQLQRRVR